MKDLIYITCVLLIKELRKVVKYKMGIKIGEHINQVKYKKVLKSVKKYKKTAKNCQKV